MCHVLSCVLIALLVHARILQAFILSIPSTSPRLSLSTGHPSGSRTDTNVGSGAVPLSTYLDECSRDSELKDVIKAVAWSCVQISQRLATLSLQESIQPFDRGGRINVQGELQKGMDVVSNEIFIHNLKPLVAAIASEESDDIIFGEGKSYAVAFDPLDGSSNLECNIPTGSIFGISRFEHDQTFTGNSGRSLVVAGYALYSSATELVITFGENVTSFTLDPPKMIQGADAFYQARPSILCPPRGPYYSLNDAREPDWPDGLKRWIYDAKRGLTPAKQKYSSRYVCSLCADFHRTLLHGGWAGNPRPHLRLLYEAAPLSFVIEAAGGKGSNGEASILDLVPRTLHDRVPLFLGSAADITDLENYGDVQQGGNSYSS